LVRKRVEIGYIIQVALNVVYIPQDHSNDIFTKLGKVQLLLLPSVLKANVNN